MSGFIPYFRRRTHVTIYPYVYGVIKDDGTLDLYPSQSVAYHAAGQNGGLPFYGYLAIDMKNGVIKRKDFIRKR